MNLYNVNKDLQQYSINKVIGTNQRVTVIDDFQGPGIPVGNDSQLIDNAFMYGVGEQYNWLADVAGLKGFALQAFVTGEANQDARMIENSGYAYSINNDFWEANLGGLGGELSEITRRFIPKRNNNVEYVNPIRNTMPVWMPGSDYFTDFKHGDPYSKVDNGEERLPGEGYERLHNIKNLMEFNIGSSSIGYEKEYIVGHMLKTDKYMSAFEEETLEKGNEIHEAIGKSWLKAGLAIDLEGKVEDKRNGIIGWYDAKVHDVTSPTGLAIVDIKSTSAKKLEELRKSGQPLTHHMRQVNYYLWATGNTQSKGYIHYVDKENPYNTYTVGFNYSQEELETTLNNVYEARKTIRNAVETGEIGRGDLYSTLDRFRILADVAPYSQEFSSVAAQLSKEDLSEEERKEVAQIRDRVSQQKEPLRVYDYKFKTANLKSETVTVAKVIDNNTIVTKEYGKTHSIKFAGINVSSSDSEMYDEKRTKKEAARDVIRHYIRPGAKIKIAYDVDEHNKYSKDSTRSIRAIVYSNGQNVNRTLLKGGHATEKENDDSPAAIRARYSKGEIAFGSAMEVLTHDVVSNIPFIGSKFMQVRSPYEQYRKREVYSKDFQSWNHPIRDILIPHIEENIADNRFNGLGGILVGGFIGSIFGKNKYGKIVGAVVGATVPAVGKIAFVAGSDKERDWRPKRRRDQEKLNEYVDTLKYVKNMRLYNQYKEKAKKENNFDVERFMKSKESKGISNKLRQDELTDYKRKVKLDFKHRDSYNFKYGRPKYIEKSMDKKETIRAINQEISELQSQRKVTKVPANAIKAIQYKQMAEQTMYGYDPGDSLVDIMKALPKKERQYFKHFVDAPEEEKQKILRIAPSYLRRALQSTWGMTVDKKPSLQEYFQSHGLPDASWIGWDESTNIDDVKVKLIHQNKLDPGEFDVWDDDLEQADQVNIPIPMIDAKNSPRETQIRLNQILGKAGYEDIQMSFVQSSSGDKTSLVVRKDARDDVSQQINNLQI
jgi:endonuclease YncB( thermonuclease family)